MKRIFLSIPLLALCLLLLLSSCTPVKPGEYDTQVTGSETQAPLLPNDPSLILGKWHSEKSEQVIEFFSDGTLKLYRLAPGYYEYESVSEGTYTYDGLTLVYRISDEEPDVLTCTIAGTTSTLTSTEKTLQFTRTETLPQEHPEYVFPDYEELAKKYPLTVSSLTGNTISTTIPATVEAAVQLAYWNSKPKTEWKTLESGTATENSCVNIDYTGYLNGEIFQGGSATGAFVDIANSGFVPGFAEGIVGHSVGEEFDVNLTFPENYYEEFAGKAVVFHMKLNFIYDMTVTDEMAKEKGYESLDDWKTVTLKNALKDEIWDLIPGLSDAEIPEEAYLYFVQINLDMIHYYASYYGYDVETYMSLVGLSMEDLTDQCRVFGKEYLQSAQVFNALSLTIGTEFEEKAQADYISMLVQNGYVKEQAETYIETEGKNEFRAYMILEFVSEYLVENNIFVAV